MSRIADALSKTADGRHVRNVTPIAAVPWDLTDADGSTHEAEAARVAAVSPGADLARDLDLIKPVSAPVAHGDADPRYAGKLVGSRDLPQAVAEQFRGLAANLVQTSMTLGTRVLMVTSAMPEEGKTFVASNLALTLSNSYGARVLLIDGDLRRPSVHGVFGVPQHPGLTDWIDTGAKGFAPVVSVSPTLSLIVAGRAQSDPMKILAGEAIQHLIRRAAAAYDWVILDTPPVALLADASLLSSFVDKVLMVIQAEKTAYDSIQKAVDTIGRERVLGTVLNRAESPGAVVGQDYYGHYLQRRPDEAV